MKIFVGFPDFPELENGKSYMLWNPETMVSWSFPGDITNKNGNIWWFRQKKMVAGVGTVTNENGEMNQQVWDYCNNGSVRNKDEDI